MNSSATGERNPPRLLAINDVHMTAPRSVREALCELYADVLGLEVLAGGDDETCLRFRGQPRSGPRLIIELVETPEEKPMRRQALLQVEGSLAPYAEALTERRIEFEWSRGWFFFDRRIGLLDPGANWIELVSSHPF
ncbi:MAG TPA: hypothetical protein PLL65_14825 [Phycisphaerae bacterium]|nr:hypothetical protein [Phycisphaerae bacterium]HON67009.1 hypothetical protein [Phycisphaerae bacterium]